MAIPTGGGGSGSAYSAQRAEELRKLAAQHNKGSKAASSKQVSAFHTPAAKAPQAPSGQTVASVKGMEKERALVERNKAVIKLQLKNQFIAEQKAELDKVLEQLDEVVASKVDLEGVREILRKGEALQNTTSSVLHAAAPKQLQAGVKEMEKAQAIAERDAALLQLRERDLWIKQQAELVNRVKGLLKRASSSDAALAEVRHIIGSDEAYQQNILRFGNKDAAEKRRVNVLSAVKVQFSSTAASEPPSAPKPPLTPKPASAAKVSKRAGAISTHVQIVAQQPPVKEKK